MKVESIQSFTQKYGTLVLVLGLDDLYQGDEMVGIMRKLGNI